jgi:UvrD-like helicase C-terminal domain
MKVAPIDFAAGDENHEGEVRSVGQMIFEREVKVTDFVLCRNNVPLVSQCFNLIKRGIRCQIVGRDIGAKLIAMVTMIDERAPTNPAVNGIVAFCDKLKKYWETEVAKLYAQEKEDAAAQLEDQLECIMVFVDNAQTVAEVKTKMTAMFDDEVNPAAVVFSTIHKAKGLEAETVWCLPARGGKTKNAKQAQEERNLLYVMITRAKKQLNWVV